MSDLVHLHVHDSHSMLGGLGKVKDYVGAAVAMGHKALALTNTGNLFASHKFQEACRKAKIKAIHGIEFYMSESDDMHRQDSSRQYRLLVLAKNQIGWENLMKLSTLSYYEGNYYVPRIDNSALFSRSEGLIVISGGLDSAMASLWRKGEESAALELARKYRDVFGEDFYLETLPYEMFTQSDFNRFLAGLSKLDGFKIVATNGIRFPSYDLSEYYYYLMLMAVKGSVNNSSRVKEFSKRMYYVSRKNMFDWFVKQEFDEAIVNGWLDRTLEIALKVNPLEFKADFKLPKFEVSDVDVLVPPGSFYEQEEGVDEETDSLELDFSKAEA